MSENKHESGDIDGALKNCDKTLKINPQDDKVWANKGSALSNLGRKEEAIKCYDRALEINPQDDSVWHKKGCCWGSLGVHDEAYRCFDRALEINPANKDARNNRDVALNMMKNRG